MLEIAGRCRAIVLENCRNHKQRLAFAVGTTMLAKLLPRTSLPFSWPHPTRGSGATGQSHEYVRNTMRR